MSNGLMKLPGESLVGLAVGVAAKADAPQDNPFLHDYQTALDMGQLRVSQRTKSQAGSMGGRGG